MSKKKKRQKKAKKTPIIQNPLAHALKLLTRRQRQMPEVSVLRKALKTLHQLPKKTELSEELEQQLSVALAYKKDTNLERATSAIQENKQILIFDHEQNLILKVSLEAHKILYQGILFNVKQIRTACDRAYNLKAEIAQKQTKENRVKLLAQIPSNLKRQIKSLQQEAEQPAKVIDPHSHIHWLKQIQEQEHSAYVEFLNSAESIANIAMWTKDEIVAMQQLLNQRLKVWQVLAKWKLSKHPIKYKPLQLLIS